MRTSLDATELHSRFFDLRPDMWAWLEREGIDRDEVAEVQVGGEGVVRCRMLRPTDTSVWQWVTVPVSTPPPFITWP